MGAPVGWKWRVLRVTTVRPCWRAVAAMRRSAPLVAEGGGEAAPAAGGGDVDAEQAVGKAGEGALHPRGQLAGEVGILGHLPGNAPFDLRNGDDAEVYVRGPLVPQPGCRRGVTVGTAEGRNDVGVEQVHHQATSRRFSEGPSSRLSGPPLGMDRRCWMKSGAPAFSAWHSRP